MTTFPAKAQEVESSLCLICVHNARGGIKQRGIIRTFPAYYAVHSQDNWSPSLVFKSAQIMFFLPTKVLLYNLLPQAQNNCFHRKTKIRITFGELWKRIVKTLLCHIGSLEEYVVDCPTQLISVFAFQYLFYQLSQQRRNKKTQQKKKSGESHTESGIQVGVNEVFGF